MGETREVDIRDFLQERRGWEERRGEEKRGWKGRRRGRQGNYFYFP